MADPSTIFSANLKLWLKAGTGCYSDAGTTLCTDGQQVQQWNDQSGNGNNATQATLANRPFYYSSLGGPVVSTEIGATATDGGDAWMSLPVGLSINRQTCSVFLFGQLMVNNLQHIMLDLGTNNLWLENYQSRLQINNGANVFGFDVELQPDQRLSMFGVVTASGSQQIYWRDRFCSLAAGPTSVVGTGGSLFSLSAGSTNRPNMRVFEVVVVAATATPQNVADLLAYFEATYAATNLTDTGRLVCFGDSLTKGVRSTGCYSYPQQIAAQLPAGTAVYNTGITGLHATDVVTTGLQQLMSTVTTTTAGGLHHAFAKGQLASGYRSIAALWIGSNDLTASETNLAGTVTVANGSAAVVGSSTTFMTQCPAGIWLQFGADTTYYQVLSRTDDTHLTLTAPYGGALTSGNTYVAPLVANSIKKCAGLLRNAGYSVCVLTLLTRTDVTSTNETKRTTCNTWMRNNYSTFADAVADVAGDTNLQTNTNATYFASDHIHLTNAGYLEVANIVATAVTPLFLAQTHPVRGRKGTP